MTIFTLHFSLNKHSSIPHQKSRLFPVCVSFICKQCYVQLNSLWPVEWLFRRPLVALGTRLQLRPKSIRMNHLAVITVVENLGVLFESSDLSKRPQPRVNLISRKFLGNAASHQVIRFWFWFHQSDRTIHRKTATFTDFSFSLYKSVNLNSAK